MAPMFDEAYSMLEDYNNLLTPVAESELETMLPRVWARLRSTSFPVIYDLSFLISS